MAEQQIILSKLEYISKSVKDGNEVPIRIKVKTDSGLDFEESLRSAREHLQRAFTYERVGATIHLSLPKPKIYDLAKQPYIENIDMG